MNSPNDNRLCKIASLLFAMVLLTATLAWSASTRAGDSSHRFNGNQEAYIGAIEKTGFYKGIIKDSVTILDEKSYRELRYRPDDDMKVTRDGQVIELDSLLPHSIVKLIIVDAEVVEIVLLQESS